LSNGELHRANATDGNYVTLGFDRAEIAFDVGEMVHHKNRFGSPKEELTPGELLDAAEDARLHGGDNPRSFLMAYHWRLGQALMPLAFALLGTPLAMVGRRTSRARGYLLTLGAYILYYLLTRACGSFGEQGRLPLLLAGQLPNLFFSGLGALAILRVARAGRFS
jgi:lipopolysaccharide export system permease protein